MSITLDGTLGITAPTYGGSVTAEYSVPVTGFKSRIINGAMVIDQRNAGASVTINSNSTGYPIDRWYGQGESSDGVFTLQQISDAPTGFINSVRATVTTVDSSIGSSQAYRFVQRIEGNNLADFNLGLVGASAFTISFWVKSSVTGTFGGSLWGAGATEWFVFSYVINSANTWEYKTVTVPARTSGSFNTTNGVGLQLQFSLGAGSSRLTTAGSWINTGAAEYYGVTGQTNLITTNGATWQVTGVQLEKGSTATSFDYRPYGTELALCQRYFAKIYGADSIYIATKYTTSKLYTTFTLPVTPRATPSVTIPSGTYYAADYNFANFDSNPSVSSTDTTEYGSNVNVVWNISWNPAAGYICRIGGNTAANLWFSMEL